MAPDKTEMLAVLDLNLVNGKLGSKTRIISLTMLDYPES